MNCWVFAILVTIIVGIIPSSCVFAIDLIDVYKEALKNDPTFKAANAQWLADKEDLVIKTSLVLPQLNAIANLNRTSNSKIVIDQYSNTAQYYDNTTSYQLQLKQSIFDFGNWSAIWQAQAMVKKAEARFMSAAEDLLLRTANAYFEVLQAEDIFLYSKANKEWLEHTLDQNINRYDAGLIPVTDLENARARYDQSVADEIANSNNLADKFEKLCEITGVRYKSLDTVKEYFPLLSPKPEDIESWVKASEQQNYDLAIAKYDTVIARENIKIQNSGHLPTIDASGVYSYGNHNNYQGTGLTGRDKTLALALELNVPLVQGGRVMALAKQADYNYQKAISCQEKEHRLVISNTRQAYLGVIANISQIKANKQAIKSAQSSIEATKAGYEAGIRTMVDVLEAQSQLYNNQKQLAASEYGYIIKMLNLKRLAGILDINDIMQINAWLKKQRNSQTYQAKNNKNKINKPNSITTANNTTTTNISNTSNSISVADKPDTTKPTIKVTTATNNTTNNTTNTKNIDKPKIVTATTNDTTVKSKSVNNKTILEVKPNKAKTKNAAKNNITDNKNKNDNKSKTKSTNKETKIVKSSHDNKHKTEKSKSVNNKTTTETKPNKVDKKNTIKNNAAGNKSKAEKPKSTTTNKNTTKSKVY